LNDEIKGKNMHFFLKKAKKKYLARTKQPKCFDRNLVKKSRRDQDFEHEKICFGLFCFLN
jgi:hypothetical protein